MAKASGPTQRIAWTAEEEVEFAALFSVAWALKGTDASRAAIETIEQWNDDRLWRRAQLVVAHRAAERAEIERLVRLLRATDPATIGRKVAA